MSLSSLLLLCIILLSFVYISQTATMDAMYTTEEGKTAPLDFLRYGLLQNASMFAHVEIEQADKSQTIGPTYFLVCSEDDYFYVHENFEICDYLNYGQQPCRVTQLFDHSLRLFYYFPEFGEYYFSIVQCNHTYRVEIMIHLELENPKGNNLPSSLIPAPTMFILLAIMWTIVLLVWLFVAAPKWKNMSPLQYTMLSYPVLKIICSACSTQYFYSYQVYEDVSTLSWIVYKGLLIIVLLDFHYILLILSKAWSISGLLDKSDYHLMFSMLVGLCCSLMFKYFYDDSDLAFLLASLAYIGLRVMILACVFININHTIARFEAEMLNYNAEAESVNIRPTVVKLHKIFVLIKFALMLWVILNVAEFFCNILFFGGAEQNWIDIMNTEFIDFLLSLCIGILLLPNVSLQIDIRRPSSRVLEAPSMDESTPVEEESNEISPSTTSGPSTNEHGELELTTFASTSSRPSFSPISPLLTPDHSSSILSTRTNNYQKVEYQVEDEEEYASDDEVQLTDKRRANVQ